MRDEVLTQMEIERKEGPAVATIDQDTHTEPGTAITAGASTTPATGFRFAALGKELVVAGVFVGVYNQQPNFAVADPAAFCRGLVTFIHSRMKPEIYYASLSSKQQDPGHSTGTPLGLNAISVQDPTLQSLTTDRPHGQASPVDSPNMEGQPQQEEKDHVQQSDTGDAQQRSRQEVVQALQALINILQAVPKLTALMASRPAITPLLNCLEPICRWGSSVCFILFPLCMHVGMHSHMYTCTRVGIHTNLSLHIHRYARTHANTQMHLAHTHACMR